MSTPTLVFVPGWHGSGPEHWQSIWEQKFGGGRVEQDDWQHPDPLAWTARLADVVRATPGELVLVAHSLGVPTVVRWAAEGQVPERVRGALLVSPPDLERPADPETQGVLRRFLPLPETPLPFPALVVASENDPYSSFERAEQMADAWDAAFVTAGEAGHINVESGHGAWPEGEVLLGEVLHAWTPPEISRF